MSSTAKELVDQWSNPGDILSLLLLIGGDIVQKATAQLIGHTVPLPGRRKTRLSIAPVVFSFGWVAYGFLNLLAAIGGMRLMPESDFPSITVNCSNAFVRETKSWILGRLLRDHETRHDVDPRSREAGGRAESIRVDIFNLAPVSRPDSDAVWLLGYLTLLVQILIAVPPLVLYGDWAILLVTLAGNVLAAMTCAMPQWTQEKWAGRVLTRDKVTCLTRGNGYGHIMVFIGSRGCWDIESLAIGRCSPRPETRWVSLALALLWACLLISVSGLKQNTWFLVIIGVMGMLQNLLAAGAPRKPGASNIHITPFARAPTIIGRREDYDDNDDSEVDLEQDLARLKDISIWASGKPDPKHTVAMDMPRWLSSMSKEDGVPHWLEAARPDAGDTGVIYAAGVHGALMELEKWVPTAGLAMVQVFFPAGLKYSGESIRDNVHKKFWQRAYHTRSVRVKADEKRRAQERSSQLAVEAA